MNTLKIYINYIIIFSIFAIFFIYFGDRRGLEGDDVAQITGIVNYEYSQNKSGIYAYYVHPLSIEVSLAVYKLFKKIEMLWYLPSIIAIICFTLIYSSIKQYSPESSSLVILSSIFIFPELLCSGLYYNSTIFGLLPLSVALFFIFWRRKPEEFTRSICSWKSMIVGATTILACMFRIDFVFSIMILFYILLNDKSKYNISIKILFSTMFATVFIFYMTGIFNINQILEEIRKRENFLILFQWNYIKSFNIIFSITNIIIWIILLLCFIYTIVYSIKNKDIKKILIVIPILAILLSLKGVTTAKHLVPLIIFMPFLIFTIKSHLSKIFRRDISFSYNISLIFIAILFNSFQFKVLRDSPYVSLRMRPSFVHTHDGPRANGAYFRVYDAIRSGARSHLYIRIAQRIPRIARATDSDEITIAYFDRAGNDTTTAWSWAWPSLYLQIDGYQIISFSENKHIVLAKENKHVKMVKFDKHNYDRLPAFENGSVIKYPFIYEIDNWNKLNKFNKELKKIERDLLKKKNTPESP